MNEKIYNNLIEKIKSKENVEIDLNYERYVAYIEILRQKINYNLDVFYGNQKLFELSEMAVLTWGLFGFSTINFLEQEDDKHIGIVFHSLTTQISNSMLSILILSNNCLDMQTGIMLRSSCELCYTLLVVLINEKKREKYFNASKLKNEIKTWNEEFKFYQLNKELKIFEDKLSCNNKFASRTLSSHRKSLYKHYSEYTHNTFLSCWLNSYTYDRTYKNNMFYNVWGEKPTRTNKYLTSLCELNMFTCLDLINFIVENIDIKKYVGNNKTNQRHWNDAGSIYLVFREYYLEYINSVENK